MSPCSPSLGRTDPSTLTVLSAKEQSVKFFPEIWRGSFLREITEFHEKRLSGGVLVFPYVYPSIWLEFGLGRHTRSSVVFCVCTDNMYCKQQ
jgi:hypothetical protein